MQYRVKVTLTYEDEVEANDDTEATMHTIDKAPWFGDWDCYAEEIGGEDDGAY